MLFNLFIISSLTAGISLIWKNFLNDVPKIQKWMRGTLPFAIRKPMFCGFCFTLWTAFFATLAVNPLSSWHMNLSFAAPPWVSSIIEFLASWMAVAVAAIIITTVVILLEELTHHMVHAVNGRPGDLH